MRILIAEDDPVSRLLLQTTLRKWGFDVVSTPNGEAAWGELAGEDPPHVAILDWMMPGLDGVEICRRARATPRCRGLYILLLTARASRQDVVEGLEAGADDYLAKPVDMAELRARVNVGVRVERLQSDLANRVRDLEQALAQVKELRGMLPICAYCKKIRDDRNYWTTVETYVAGHSHATFSHGICPDCFEKHVRGEIELLEKEHSEG